MSLPEIPQELLYRLQASQYISVNNGKTPDERAKEHARVQCAALNSAYQAGYKKALRDNPSNQLDLGLKLISSRLTGIYRFSGSKTQNSIAFDDARNTLPPVEFIWDWSANNWRIISGRNIFGSYPTAEAASTYWINHLKNCASDYERKASSWAAALEKINESDSQT